jgi:16S rRNA (cytosine967-C5)-methyltransferase
MANIKNRPKNAREVALDVLVKVEKEKSYSNLELNEALNQAQLQRNDAGLVTEIVYGTIQRKLTLDWILDRFLKQGVGKVELWVRNLLRLSLYQIWYLERIPERAAINEAVEIAKRRGHQGISGMVNGVLRNIVRQKSDIQFPSTDDPAKRIALEHSHPEWMVKRWITMFGEQTAEEICLQNNQPPNISLRVNSLRMSRDRLLEAMMRDEMEVEPSNVSPMGILVRSGGNIGQTRWFKEGFCTIQDESSMLVSQLLSPNAGSRVLDCCAAPGGKTTHLAELMQNEGTIMAADIHPHKIELIRQNKERLGVDIIRTIQADARELDKAFNDDESFDFILLDAPCSGLGVIRRKPDIKWSKSASDIDEITSLQKAILHSAATLLKPKGVLVYSTCTIEPSENEQMIADFLIQHPQFSLDPEADSLLASNVVHQSKLENGMYRILPSLFGSDGFFMARLVKHP